ncbi:MFS transporter [Gryllotalpicola ginsengisoli]|uniref:MFS transporter n=1 Tax=Gryllotalpicola ginsengisoli TaxID=444608 RepID=UPI0003B4AB5E|nr:MFS transporter [Gryllotalpicola ginsengisoli]
MTSAARPAAAAVRPALALVGVLLVAANLRAAITAVGPVLPGVQHELGLSAAAASVLVSLPLVAFAAISPLAPPLARRMGVEPALAAALGVLAIGVVLRSVPGAVWLWLGTALLGAAIAVLNVVLPALVKRDFPERIGQLTGAYSCVQGAFAAIAAGVAVPVAGAGGTGWRLALGIWAGLAVIALAVVLPQLRGRAARMPQTAAGAEGQNLGRSPWRSALGWQVTAFMGLQSVGFYVLVTWLPSIERAGGVPAAEAGVHQFLFNALGIAGSLSAAGLVPRRGGLRLTATVAPGVYVVAVIGLLLAPSAGALWACLAGLAGGTMIVVALSLFGLRTAHHAQAAALSGMAQSIGYLFAAAGPVAIGAIHDTSGRWAPALLILAAVGLALVGVGFLVSRPRVIG